MLGIFLGFMSGICCSKRSDNGLLRFQLGGLRRHQLMKKPGKLSKLPGFFIA
jgi:hypothetical protein